MKPKETPEKPIGTVSVTKSQALLLRKYRKLKLAAEKAAEAADALKEDVCAVLKTLPEGQVGVQGDRLSLSQSNTYVYPAAIREADAALTAAQKAAREDGSATITKTSLRVVFTKNKASVIV